MSTSEQQTEEEEVLISIFEEDEAFKKITETCYQYKVGEDGNPKSFLIEFKWPPSYPETPPEVNLDAFYNNHVLPHIKEHIISQLNSQANNWLGDAMLFTLIDWAKENQEDLMAEQPLQIVKVVETNIVAEQPSATLKKPKKEQLTKAQKRKLADRVNAYGERARGWNWIDPIKHLSQTGYKSD